LTDSVGLLCYGTGTDRLYVYFHIKSNILFTKHIMRKVDMQQNKICIPRNGHRSRGLELKKSLCTGAEWSRRSNLVFKGKLDL